VGRRKGKKEREGENLISLFQERKEELRIYHPIECISAPREEDESSLFSSRNIEKGGS